MIINPGPIFEHAKITFEEINKWEFTGKFKCEDMLAPYIINTRCRCVRPKIAYKAITIDIKPDPIIQLKPEWFSFAGEKFVIWHGLCELCKTMYWSCENFNWVEYISDLDVARVILCALPIQHYQEGIDNKGYGIITVNAGTRLWFRDGKVLRAQGIS